MNFCQLMAILLVLLSFPIQSNSQNFVSFFNGDTSDVQTNTTPGTVLMGGSTENDSAMVWWLKRSGGGDVVVIRASGSNGYNSYLYSELGQTVNSVETILFYNRNASYDPYVIRRLKEAEALWIAGGDQWNYTSYWKNSPVDSLINWLANVKKIPVGGTSAGMAILGEAYFDAKYGSITSSEALANPYNQLVSIGRKDFIHIPILKRTITDTHFDNPDRRGRTVTFLARLYQDSGFSYKAICSEEKTAVCVDDQGKGRVFGESPTSEFAYFVKVNCEFDSLPEICQPGLPLTWSQDKRVLKVYRVPGDNFGSNHFDLTDWTTGTGGTWQTWGAIAGSFAGLPSQPPNCLTGLRTELKPSKSKIYPNPSESILYFESKNLISQVFVYDFSGKLILQLSPESEIFQTDVSDLNSGLYALKLIFRSGKTEMNRFIKE